MIVPYAARDVLDLCQSKYFVFDSGYSSTPKKSAVSQKICRNRDFTQIYDEWFALSRTEMILGCIDRNHDADPLGRIAAENSCLFSSNHSGSHVMAVAEIDNLRKTLRQFLM